ncbi:MAG: terpene cyclase/mutase family protein [Phycisphaerales bacterium]|nr:terpene cyclase/mutase family protein [Phycisphaerales bacterium]
MAGPQPSDYRDRIRLAFNPRIALLGVIAAAFALPLLLFNDLRQPRTGRTSQSGRAVPDSQVSELGATAQDLSGRALEHGEQDLESDSVGDEVVHADGGESARPWQSGNESATEDVTVVGRASDPFGPRWDAPTASDSPGVEEAMPAPERPEDARPARTGDPPEDRRRSEGVRRYGGTTGTENAVEAGLRWLSQHQAPDGTWDRAHFDRACPQGDKCGGAAIRRMEHALHAGTTGLALLAFVGAGYSDRQGPYQKQVALAVDALLKLQRPDGGFSPHPGMAGYNNSVATFALAEYYALTREPRVREPLMRATAWLSRTQQPLGGWDYLPTSESGRNDTSITAWAVQALRAAAGAGIPVDGETFVRAALHFARATESDGRVWYADAGVGFELDAGLQAQYRHGPAMAAAGLTCAPLLGIRLDAPIVKRQQALLLADPPSQSLARGRDRTQLHTEYYWYYGTIAMFQAGGEEWTRWNSRLRDALLPLQERPRSARGNPRHVYGSWQPYGQGWGRWGRMGGRVYTTAICTLTLEIYYRHTPAFLDEACVVRADDWGGFLKSADARERLLAVRVLRDSRFEIGENVLIELLSDADGRVATAAAAGLAAIDSPMGAEVIAKARNGGSAWDRSAADDAQRRIDALARLARAEGRVRLFEPERGLGTASLPRAHAGMILSVRRGGAAVGRVRVIERFSNRDVVVIAQVDGEAPAAEDRLVQE